MGWDGGGGVVLMRVGEGDGKFLGRLFFLETIWSTLDLINATHRGKYQIILKN